jgi:hypothetical protein
VTLSGVSSVGVVTTLRDEPQTARSCAPVRTEQLRILQCIQITFEVLSASQSVMPLLCLVIKRTGREAAAHLLGVRDVVIGVTAAVV